MILPFDEFLEKAGVDTGVELTLKSAPPPQLLSMMKRLQRLGLLEGDVLFSILAQAPVDPLGVYGALREHGVWAFQPFDCTMMQILAKAKGKTVALMRIDLISDDITFVTLQAGQLTERSCISADEIGRRLKEKDMTEEKMLAWITGYMSQAAKEGLEAAG